ncbi:MAG: AmmeMemoRadiSam system radical SAM enzyme [Planctomycetota bacterium]|jgi:pyruvate formate lyase activating enzyme
MSSSLKLKDLLERHTMPSAPELVQYDRDGVMRCVACGHRCKIPEGRSGVCRVRFNREGELRAPAGYVAGLQVDPIEKKPFYHVLPGRDALSFGMLGCDLHCSYCQNWVTSQALRDENAVAPPSYTSPERIASLAAERRTPVMVSTYNEPLITADWAVDIFKHARKQGIRCGFVSNGNATPEVLDFIRPYVDLYKVDLKGFTEAGYRSLGGTLKSVLETIERLVEKKFWVEIVTLLVPGFNDSDDELKKMAQFLSAISVDIPWHITAYRPDYKMTDPPRTPTAALIRAAELGRQAGLRFVYAGNSPGSVGDNEHTFCPECKALLIRRHGFLVRENRMKGDSCPECDASIPGVWEDQAPPASTGPGLPRPV